MTLVVTVLEASDSEKVTEDKIVVSEDISLVSDAVDALEVVSKVVPVKMGSVVEV